MEEITPTVEKIFYDHDNIFVSNSRVKVGSTVYAMSGITSAKISKTIERNYTYAWPVIIITIILSAVYSSPGPFIVGMLCVVAMYCGLGDKVTYSLKTTCSSGELSLLKIEDKEQLENILESINNAIVFRG